MKQTLTIFICVLIFITGFTQSNTYYPLPSVNVYWREYAGGYQNGPCTDYQHYISGDTLIGGHIYHSVSKSGVMYYQDIGGWCTNIIMNYYTTEFVGAYRNDSINKKVYGIFPGLMIDTLLYDFDLNLMDTVPTSYLYNPSNVFCYISSIDSILIANNYHKRFALSTETWINYAYLIEGIGSTHGLFGELQPPFEYGIILRCFIQEGQTVYPDTSYQCNLITNTPGIPLEKFELKILPNPASDLTTLVFNCQDEEFDLLIFNIYGQQVMSYKNIIDGLKICISDLPQGVYIYLVRGNKGKILTDKIIKLK